MAVPDEDLAAFEAHLAERRADLRARLEAGAWLLPGDVALLLGVSRKTVDRLLTLSPVQIRFRLKPGSGRFRECNPDDVQRQLTQRGLLHPVEPDPGQDPGVTRTDPETLPQ